MPYQNISQEITQAQYDAWVAKLNELKVLHTFFINLTEDERQSLPKMGNSKLPFVTKSLNYAETNPTLCPGYVNVPELRKDFQLAGRLLQMLQVIRPHVDSMDDTQLAVGSEAYVTALAFYNSVGSGGEAERPRRERHLRGLEDVFRAVARRAQSAAAQSVG